jgi:hypothetical protein
MSHEEVIDKFVSFELMIKDSKHIVNLEQGTTPTPEVQPVAFKATEEEKKESTSSRLPIDISKLDNEEMALIIKSFRQILKQRRGRTTSPARKGCVTDVVSPVTLLLNVQFLVKVTGTKTRKGRRRKCVGYIIFLSLQPYQVHHNQSPGIHFSVDWFWNPRWNRNRARLDLLPVVDTLATPSRHLNPSQVLDGSLQSFQSLKHPCHQG